MALEVEIISGWYEMTDIIIGAVLVGVTTMFACLVWKDISNHKQDVAHRIKIETFEVADEYRNHIKEHSVEYTELRCLLDSGSTDLDNHQQFIMDMINNLQKLAIKYYNLDLDRDIIYDYCSPTLIALFKNDYVKKFIEKQRQNGLPALWADAQKLHDEVNSYVETNMINKKI